MASFNTVRHLLNKLFDCCASLNKTQASMVYLKTHSVGDNVPTLVIVANKQNVTLGLMKENLQANVSTEVEQTEAI